MKIVQNSTSFLKLKSYFILIFSMIVLFTFWKEIEDENVIQKDKSLRFTRKWFDTVRTIPYMSELEIKANKTFEYHGGACTSLWFSKGSWILKNYTIILNSFEPKRCYYINEYGTFCRTLEEMKKNDLEVSIKNCKPSPVKNTKFLQMKSFT